MKRQKFGVLVKLLSVVITVLVGIFLIKCLIKSTGSQNFKIKYIITRQPTPVDLSYLKDYNIFEIDLNKESRRLSLSYPDYKKIRLIRIFPDRLFVDFNRRLPLAYIKLYRYFYVDSEGVLFNIPMTAMDASLPVIFGLETKIFGPRAGKRYDISELKLALNIIKDIHANKIFRVYRIKRIDVSNIANTSVFLSFIIDRQGNLNKGVDPANDILEIKFGPDHIKDKVNILASLLAQINNDRFNIKYVDLRFKEPVIKFKVDK